MPIDVEQYYAQYGPMVLRRCRALLKNEEEAQDAMHDVFVRLLRRQAELEDRAPSSLLYRIATNVSLNMIRTRKYRKDEGCELLEQIADVKDLQQEEQSRSLLHRLFSKSAPDTGAMAVMHWHDGFTLEEVASEFSMSVSGVRKRLRKVRSELKNMEVDSDV